MTKYLLYTSEKCQSCPATKSALKRLGVEFAEIRLKTGMILPPDVRSVPTLAMEKDGKRTTIHTFWPGSVEKLERILKNHGVPLKEKANERQ